MGLGELGSGGMTCILSPLSAPSSHLPRPCPFLRQFRRKRPSAYDEVARAEQQTANDPHAPPSAAAAHGSTDTIPAPFIFRGVCPQIMLHDMVGAQANARKVTFK